MKPIYLQQIATRDVCIIGERYVLLGDVHPFLPHFHLVADLVGAHIDIVQHQVHKLIGGVEGESGKLTHGGCHGIADECLVGGIGDERPTLRVGMVVSKESLLGKKLDAVGLLRQVPC